MTTTEAPEQLAASGDWDPNEVRLGTTGDLWRAPAGTPAPSDATSPLATPWVNLGYASDDGVTAQPSINKTDIMVWQSQYPVRERVVQMLDFKFKLVQDNGETLQLAYGGGVFDNATGLYTPPKPGEVYENAFCVDIVDGTFSIRYYIARAIVTNISDVVMKADEAIAYELTVSVLASGGASPWQRFMAPPPTLLAASAPTTEQGAARTHEAA